MIRMMQPLSSILYRSFQRSGDGMGLGKEEELESMAYNRAVAMAPAQGKNRVAVGGCEDSCYVAHVLGNSSTWMKKGPALAKNAMLPFIPRGPARVIWGREANFVICQMQPHISSDGEILGIIGLNIYYFNFPPY